MLYLSFVNNSDHGILFNTKNMTVTGLQALGGFVRDVNRNNIKPYLAELDKTRGERTKNYLQSQSIKPDESHSGFLRAERPENVNDWLVALHMDDYNFEFYYSIKK